MKSNRSALIVVGLRGRHAMREPGVRLQRPVLQEFADSGPESA